MFGVFIFCCFFDRTQTLPVGGCGRIFWMPVFGVFLLDQIFLIRIHLSLEMGCFCLESLILAQDERWRRA